MAHKVYRAIVQAVRSGSLVEPFSQNDFRSACRGLGNGTYQAFLHKHSKGNPGGNTELFTKVGPGRFKCIRPFKYGV